MFLEIMNERGALPFALGIDSNGVRDEPHYILYRMRPLWPVAT